MLKHCFLLATLSAAAALGQGSAGPHTVTFGVGGVGGGPNTGPAFNASYEYRFLPFLSIEAGLDTILPRTVQNVFSLVQPIAQQAPGSAAPAPIGYVLTPVDERTTMRLAPLGLRGILPLYHGRAELFGGLGAAYLWNSPGYFSHSVVGQATVGARIGLDRGQRFWLGSSWRFFSNFDENHAARGNWYSGTLDLGIRFGR
jgi:hypothetical protein